MRISSSHCRRKGGGEEPGGQDINLDNLNGVPSCSKLTTLFKKWGDRSDRKSLEQLNRNERENERKNFGRRKSRALKKNSVIRGSGVPRGPANPPGCEGHVELASIPRRLNPAKRRRGRRAVMSTFEGLGSASDNPIPPRDENLRHQDRPKPRKKEILYNHQKRPGAGERKMKRRGERHATPPEGTLAENSMIAKKQTRGPSKRETASVTLLL